MIIYQGNHLLSIYDNAWLNGEQIVSDYLTETGIYLWHNSVNGKQYVGSGYKLSDRLAEYYHPSKFSDNRYIYNSIWKYGHDNFSYY